MRNITSIVARTTLLFSVVIALSGCGTPDEYRSSAGLADASATGFRAMTFNIRLNTPNDGINAWPNRVQRVTGLIQYHNPDVIGLQEALHDQMQDLERELTGFGWVGVGRDDGAQAGEYSPIWYRSDRFEVEDWGTFWLSETPDDTGSVGWDAALPRIATWAHLQDLTSSGTLYVFNTHFDHVGEIARSESAKLLTARIQDISAQTPVVLLGDFNLQPDTEGYATLTGSLSDAWASAAWKYGSGATRYGFDVVGREGERIDYVFVRGFDVEWAAVLTDQLEGRYPSDHLPVLAVLAVQGE